MRSSKIIILGFLIIILIGATLLTLPIAVRSGEGNFLDSLFTSTSAVCVTGLVVRDTFSHWSPFGQFIIIVLIQIGGLGFITIATLLFILSGKRIGLSGRSLIKDSLSLNNLGGVLDFSKFIVMAVIIIELIGAIFLSMVFMENFGTLKGILYGIFHSISAFCNAGFDLLGINEPFSSLTSYTQNPVINITIMALIVVGGLGFLTWRDIRDNKLDIGHYSMQSKVILSYTLFLIIIPAIYFFFFEFNSLSPIERILPSLFQSITCRTAGFNTMDLTKISEPGIIIMIIIMLIGAAPGSTGGGMKITTIAVVFATTYRVFLRRKETCLFKRKIKGERINTALALFLFYIFMSLLGAILISLKDGFPMVKTWFETSSAIATVGLTLGITPKLSMFSKIILIILMYIGRVGGLTLIFSTLRDTTNQGGFPEEHITLG